MEGAETLLHSNSMLASVANRQSSPSSFMLIPLSVRRLKASIELLELDEQYSITDIPNESILFTRDLTFMMTIKERHALKRAPPPC